MEEKDMREARNRSYALLACLALVSTACGASLPGSGQEGVDEASIDVVGCPDGTRSDTCAKDAPRPAPPPEARCKEELSGCLATGRDEQTCRLQFEKCLASTPAPPPPPPSTEDRCFSAFRACHEATGDLDGCFVKLKVCLGSVPPPPPPPPPSPEVQCKLDYGACLERTGDPRLCQARFEQCLASIPTTPPPPPPTAEQCREQYRRCVAATGDEPGCHKRLDVCLASVPPAP
jgi:hypothetical protein